MDGRSIPRRLLPPSLLDQKEGWSNGEKLHKNDMSITALLEFGAEAAALSTQRSLNAGLGGHITATSALSTSQMDTWLMIERKQLEIMVTNLRLFSMVPMSSIRKASE